MVFRSYELRKNIYFKEIKNEKLEDYITWVNYIKSLWWEIKAIVCDWRRFNLNYFSKFYPVQMCQFHQIQIITRYITKKPKLEANIRLREITLLLTKTDKESFTFWLDEWYEKYRLFLDESSINPISWKMRYIHSRTRSAYNSLKRNLQYLWTWYDFIWIFDIPNTTNSLDWSFTHLKTKLKLHPWLKKERRLKVAFSLLDWK